MVFGVIFVAAMLPATMPSASAGLTDAILAGLVSNTIILAVVLIAAGLIQRLRR